MHRNPAPAKLSPVQKQKEYLSIATAFLSQGLKHDETREHAKAVECYTKGLEVLREALNQQYPSPPPEVEAVNETMRRHLANFADRVGTLEVLLRQPPKPAAKPTSGGVLSKLFGGKPKPPPEGGGVAEPSPEDEQLARLQYNFSAAAKAVERKGAKPQPSGKRTRSTSASARPPVAGPPIVPKPPAKKAPGRHAGPSPPAADPNDALVRRLQRAGVEPKLLDQVLSSIVARDQVGVRWEDVTGLAEAKQALYEAAILPLQRPDLFTGLRAPARGILLFGPPGTGKTYIAKACAHTVRATFFSVSASTLTSKYVGEGEKLVKAVFMAAQELQPSIIFIDEVDSLLTARSESDNEASRRLKTEFMIQMEGLNSAGESKNVLVLGATNRPYELDDAVLRRFPKRLSIPLPDASSRELLFASLAGKEFQLSPAELKHLAKLTDGYSNSDITNVCREAALMPVRELGPAAASVSLNAVRPVRQADVLAALKVVRPSASEQQLRVLQKWAAKYGS